jgi:hypothetical protein
MSKQVTPFHHHRRYCPLNIIELAFLGLLRTPALSLEQVGLYDVFEAPFTATRTYGNPYLEAPVTVTFKGPSRQRIVWMVFGWGKTWRVRMAPTELGTWTYKISSFDPGLDGRSGSFEAVGSAKK